jgi:hypothetical protein
VQRQIFKHATKSYHARSVPQFQGMEQGAWAPENASSLKTYATIVKTLALS